jgi:integrase
LAKHPEHLRLHRRLWRYDRYISPELRPFMPEGYRGTRFRVYLKTPDVSVALRMKPRLDAQFAEIIEQARKRRLGEDDPLKWAIDVALEIRELEADGVALPDEVQAGALETLPAHLRPVFREALVTGAAPVAIDQRLAEWLDRTKHLHPKTLLERRITIQNLKEWSTLRGIGDARKVTREDAKAFIKGHEGKAASTVSKVLQAVRGYWTFLKDEGVAVDPEVWKGLTPKRSRRDELQDRERPFTEAELKKLFDGAPSARLFDTMRIALLTGMRLAEIGDLRVEHVDLKKLTVNVPGTKAVASSRIIPLHPTLVPLMKARTKGKEAREYIIDELEDRERKYGRKRSGALTMEFMRYRQSVGVDDTREGKRRALVNFHSFRRTADRYMIEAGVAPIVIDSFFGWKNQGAMRVRYAVNADLMRQMRDALAWLKLPS